MSTSLIEQQLTNASPLVSCADSRCSAPAYIEDRWSSESTDGPLEMVKVRCLAGCWYTVPAADVSP